jgi:hypothetical protein
MRISAKILAMMALMLWLSGASVQADSQPPAVGGQLPDFQLEVPQDSEQQLYLGVDGKQTFAIPEIRAEVVLIEIFSMY